MEAKSRLEEIDTATWSSLLNMQMQPLKGTTCIKTVFQIIKKNPRVLRMYNVNSNPTVEVVKEFTYLGSKVATTET